MWKIENLTKSFGDFKALDNISFELREGRVHGFLGRNGAGKSTTMNILSGILSYDSGFISYKGQDYKNIKSQVLRSVGYAPQDHHFYEYMTAEEYLRFLGKLTNIKGMELKSQIDGLLDFMNLKEHKRKVIGEYSGGMKQRLAVASAIFNNPNFIILDEPTSALDPEGRGEILEFIRLLKHKGITVFLSTHILSDVERICDDVTIIEKGKILISDELRHLKNKYMKPAFDINIEGDIQNISRKLSESQWIDEVKASHDSISVLLKDTEVGRVKLIPEIISMGGIIKSYNPREMSLEDIFTRTVKGNE